MISFMILGGPRSATTWMANWLTTDDTLCLHDPLLEYTVSQLSTLSVPGKKLGLADTALLMYPEWVAAQRCPKILLWRDTKEINTSLAALGLNQLDPGKHAMRMGMVDAQVYHWNEVFKGHVMRKICKHLDVPYCPYRFNSLVNMNIQPQWQRLPVAKDAAAALVARMKEVL